MKSVFFAGSSSPQLAREICRCSGFEQGRFELGRFSDGETYVNIETDVKGKNVFVLQSCPAPANHNLMELLIITDAARRLGSKIITVILPFFAYRRQEKKTKSGESITAELVARLLEAAGANKVITLDIHTDKILKFFKIPAKNLEATPLFLEYFKKFDAKNLVVMAPDRGACQDVRRFAKKLGSCVAWAEKKRASRHDRIQSMKFHGKVQGKDVLIIDDEINTAGTLCEAAGLLKKAGAKNIYAACTHPVFSGQALDRLKAAPIKQIICTNTIRLSAKKIRPLKNKLKILSVAPIVASAIK